MTIDFYYTPGSAPCRSILLVAKAIGIDLNLILVDLRKKEQLRLEFTKINLQHTIPTLVDNGFILWDSQRIITYLVRKYGKNDSLYPKDKKKRVLVDQMLNFDLEKLYPCFADCYYPMIFTGVTTPDPDRLTKTQKIFKTFDSLLKDRIHAAGDDLTIADLTLVATVSTFDVMSFNLASYRNVIRWYTRIRFTAPGYEEANGKNVTVFKHKLEMLSNKLEHH